VQHDIHAVLFEERRENAHVLFGIVVVPLSEEENDSRSPCYFLMIFYFNKFVHRQWHFDLRSNTITGF